jgi:hypothetical protein
MMRIMIAPSLGHPSTRQLILVRAKSGIRPDVGGVDEMASDSRSPLIQSREPQEEIRGAHGYHRLHGIFLLTGPKAGFVKTTFLE